MTVSATRSTGVTVLEEGVALVTSEAEAVDPAAHAAVSRPPVVAGRLADLDDDSIVVNEEWLTTEVGDRVSVWLGDGRTADLRIAAVLATGTGDNGVYVTERNACPARPSTGSTSRCPRTARTARRPYWAPPRRRPASSS